MYIFIVFVTIATLFGLLTMRPSQLHGISVGTNDADKSSYIEPGFHNVASDSSYAQLHPQLIGNKSWFGLNMFPDRTRVSYPLLHTQLIDNKAWLNNNMLRDRTSVSQYMAQADLLSIKNVSDVY